MPSVTVTTGGLQMDDHGRKVHGTPCHGAARQGFPSSGKERGDPKGLVRLDSPCAWKMKVLFNEKIAQSYDHWAETPQGRKAYGLEGELLLRLGELAVGQRVLEVGCGTGAHLAVFLKEGLDVTGVDISPHMLRVAKNRLGKGVRLCLGDTENLPFREKTFDCVALITTL